MKKNTLLYLDSDLVDRAKRENINISRLTEETLKQALEIRTPRTAQEHLQRLLTEVGSESSFYGETYFLSFQIESLKLTNVGLFDNFEAHFRQNSINVIHGSCGSGKSTIIRSILLALGIQHRYFTNRIFNDGAIKLRLFPNQDSISITGIGNQNSTRGYQCLIADDSLERLPKNMIAPFFAELNGLGIQVIITASLLIDIAELQRAAHIIQL